jgi:hypothetical protein
MTLEEVWSRGALVTAEYWQKSQALEVALMEKQRA